MYGDEASKATYIQTDHNNSADRLMIVKRLLVAAEWLGMAGMHQKWRSAAPEAQRSLVHSLHDGSAEPRSIRVVAKFVGSYCGRSQASVFIPSRR